MHKVVILPRFQSLGTKSDRSSAGNPLKGLRSTSVSSSKLCIRDPVDAETGSEHLLAHKACSLNSAKSLSKARSRIRGRDCHRTHLEGLEA